MIINSRNDKSMPMNSEVMFDVSRIIKPKKLVVPYYTLGTENVAWVAAREDNLGDRNKELDHLMVEAADPTDRADWAWATDIEMDLSGVNTLYIDWELTGDGGVQTRAYFNVDDNQLGNVGAFFARVEIFYPFARRVDTVDVSSLSGSYYLRFHARDANLSGLATSTVRTYRVWGEG